MKPKFKPGDIVYYTKAKFIITDTPIIRAKVIGAFKRRDQRDFISYSVLAEAEKAPDKKKWTLIYEQAVEAAEYLLFADLTEIEQFCEEEIKKGTWQAKPYK